MLRLFKHISFGREVASSAHMAALFTVSEQLKPMTELEFEYAEQTMETAYDWLFPSPSTCAFANAGHFSLHDHNANGFQVRLTHFLGQRVLPVVLANTHEALLHSLPFVSLGGKEVGIIHIGAQFQLKPSLELCVGSAYHFALSRYNDCRAFYLGIDENSIDAKTIEYAEDLGCDWMTATECTFRNRFQLKSQLSSYLAHCDEVVLDIDLVSLMPQAMVNLSAHLELQMAMRMIRQCMMAGKVKLIQMVGQHEKVVYHKHTQKLLADIVQMLPSRNRAA
ncbi:arginase [Vibrio paucivorans]